MYDNIIYYGKTLKEWTIVLHNQYTAGELYRMMADNVDFTKLVSLSCN